jgi:hypothetical protein
MRVPMKETGAFRITRMRPTNNVILTSAGRPWVRLLKSALPHHYPSRLFLGPPLGNGL